MSGRTDEQNRSLLFGGTTFAFQADRKSFYIFRFLNRLEANLRNTVLIYPHNTCANWVLVLGIDGPQLIILPRLRRGKIADANHTTLTARLPCHSRFRIGWSWRRWRESVKRRLHQRVGRAYIGKLAPQPYAIESKQAAKQRQRRRYGPRYPAKRSAPRRHWNDPCSFHRCLTHDALL